MDGNVVVVDGKVKTPKPYAIGDADSLLKNTRSTLRNI
jgi:hypothetical protein